MFYCIGKHIEKWLRHCSRNGRRESLTNFGPPFGLERSDIENQNKRKSKPTKTLVRRKTDPARRDDLPWSMFDSSTGTQNTSDKKRISLAEMSITRIYTWILHIHTYTWKFTGKNRTRSWFRYISLYA